MGGWLIHVESGRRHRLAPRSLIGRSPQADLHLPGTWVSGEHAVVSWSGDGWRVRDLGSSNGTTLDGVPLSCRRDHELKADSALAFGQGKERWRFEGAGAPEAQALGPGGVCVVAADEVLSLPDDVAPVASVHREGGQWLLERQGEPEPVRDRALVVIGDQAWCLRLPETRLDTVAHLASRRLSDFTLELAHSLDEEKIEVRLLAASHRVVLDPRSHHYMLIVLARHALEQRAAGVSVVEAGWLDAAALANMLKVPRGSLNVHIHRIRRQVQAAGIFDGKDILQRMPGTHEIRLAPIAMRVVSLSEALGGPPATGGAEAEASADVVDDAEGAAEGESPDGAGV